MGRGRGEEGERKLVRKAKKDKQELRWVRGEEGERKFVRVGKKEKE